MLNPFHQGRLVSNNSPPNRSLQLIGAAIPVLRNTMLLQAAPTGGSARHGIVMEKAFHSSKGTRERCYNLHWAGEGWIR